METKNKDSKKWANDIIRKIDNGYIKRNFSKEEIALAKDLLKKAQTDVSALNQFHAAFPIKEKREVLIAAFTPKVSKKDLKVQLEIIIAEEDRKDNRTLRNLKKS